MEDQEQETKRDPLEAARDDLHNSVSVAGWKEAFGEKIGWIRLCFQISLIVLCGSCIYSNYVSIRRFANASDIKDEITDVPNSSSMPFSNVTVCAQLYFNITFLKEVLIIPESVIRQYERTHRGDLEELYQQLALYLPFVGRPRSFTANELVLFSKVLRANPRLREYSDFSSSATAQCSQMLKRCWFNGIEFDCCANVFQSVDDDGICYLLILNFDSDNAKPTSRTIRQTNPGPKGGLMIEASVSVQEFPWLESDAQNGFRVYVNPVPYTAIQSPLTAPHAAETFIKVTPSLHSLAGNCVGSGHLSTAGGGFYDPEGMNCVGEKLEDVIYEFFSCRTATYVSKPNSSSVCGPLATWVLTSALSSDMTGVVQDEQINAISMDRRQRFVQETEHKIRTVLSNTGRCLTHCHYWTYDSVSSFSDLIATDATKALSRMYAKIRVYYTELGYRHFEQERQPTVYLAFCKFGNLANLYLGMSIVSFFDIFFYVTQYFCIRRRVQRGKGKVTKYKRIRTVRVHPLTVTTGV